MKSLLPSVFLAVLTTACSQQKPDPRDAEFLAAGEQAIVGSYTLQSPKVGKELLCTLDVSTNHTFVISNLPVAGASKTVTGSWSLQVYHVFGDRRYTVSFAGVTNIVKARFPNADLPEGTTPTQLSVWWVEGQGQPVDYLFSQIQNITP
jgi:hypothetical protein